MALVSSATSKVYSGFSPTSIPGCALWLDAADSNTLTMSGGNVTAWKDKSSNGYTATNLGTITTTTQNGVPALNFGTNRMTIASYAWNTHSTMFIVARAITSGNFIVVQVINNNEYTNFVFTGNWTLWQGYTGGSKFTLEDNTVAQGASVVGANQLFCLAFGYAGGTSASHYTINGTSRPTRTVTGSAVSDGTTTQPLYINGRWDSSVFDNSIVCEIIHYNGTLTAAQRQVVEGYLQSKWGLQSSFSATHPYKSIPVTLRPFTPLDLPDCGLWLDAIDPASVTVSNTSNVTLWKDKSGRGWNFSQTTAGRYPVYTSNALGTRQMLSFTGAANQGAATQVLDNMSFQLSNSNYSIFVVTNRGATAPSYTGYNYVLKATPNNDGVLFFGNIPSKDFAVFTGANLDQWNEVSGNSPAISTLNSTRILGMVSSNTTYTPYYDGKSMTSKNGGTFAFTGLRIGDAGDPGPRSGQNWNGFIGEIVIYNQSLSTTARQQLEGYLAWRWGKVSDLPTTHPFKLAPPLVPAFTPLQIAGCALWFDAADRSTITTSGGYVTLWNDKSGNARHASNVGTGAISGTTTINGLNTIQFASGSNYLLTPSFTMDAFTRTVFVVFRFTSNAYPTDAAYYLPTFMASSLYPADSGMAFQLTRGNGSPDYAWHARLGNNNGVAPITNSSFHTGASGPNNQAFIISIQRTTSSTGFGSFTGSNAGGRVDTTLGYATTESYAIGGSAFTFSGGIWGTNANGLSNTQIGELLYYNQALSLAQFQQVEGYLAQKWGLKPNLPASHGFKTITP